MSEMLQKMARRMYEDEAKRVGYSDAQLAMWDEYPQSVRGTWEGRARSALAALQQPTDEILMAAYDQDFSEWMTTRLLEIVTMEAMK